MGEIYWRFPRLDGPHKEGYTDNGIEGFRGAELLDNLTREIIQNSLDARLPTATQVKVVFELKYFKNDYKTFTGYKECLELCRECWGEGIDIRLKNFIDGAEKTLQEKKIPVLIASDYNTTGLTGSRKPEDKYPWSALTSWDGVSEKQSSNSGGSYGIGKNAPFACSSLSMVFYNTFATDNESAFIGVARLATLLRKKDREKSQRKGTYQDNDEDNRDENKRYLPIYDMGRDAFRDEFKRNKTGTDVIIAGFTEASHWMEDVKKAVLENFFVAITEGHLVVELRDENNDVIINGKTLPRLFAELEMSIGDAAHYYAAFTDPDYSKRIDVLEAEDVEIYIKANDVYKNKTANFRSTGMLIHVSPLRRKVDQHFAAVIVVRGGTLGELLRETEPTSHNKWEPANIIYDERRRIQAKNAIKKIRDAVFEFVTEKFNVKTEGSRVDAAGMQEYFPLSSEESDIEDALQPTIKVSVRKPVRQSEKPCIRVGEEGEGTEDINEGNKGGHKGERDGGSARRRGGRHRGGPDTSRPAGMLRAYSHQTGQGKYRIVFIPEEDCTNVYIQCFAIGEDANQDPLDMEKFLYDDKEIPIIAGKAGPVEVKAETPANFTAVFAQKEKMVLNVQLTEGGAE